MIHSEVSKADGYTSHSTETHLRTSTIMFACVVLLCTCVDVCVVLLSICVLICMCVFFSVNGYTVIRPISDPSTIGKIQQYRMTI